MKQRAKLAQAIVHDPKLVFLDEPTAGLDPSGREEMLDLIERLGSFGIDVVVSSHVLRDIERTCDWVVMLDEGTLLHAGPIGDQQTDGAVLLELIDDPQPVVTALAGVGASVTSRGRTMEVSLPNGDVYDAIRDAVVQTGASIRRLDGAGGTLEDMFLHHGERR
jgi:ABC-2 type transport system ATP-binding protein